MTINHSDLLEQIVEPENLLNAWRSVRNNIPGYRRHRSAGPDGVSIEEYERDLTAQLHALRHAIIKCRYRPQQPGKFTINKPNGGVRQIAILNVSDRIVQRAAQQVIEPVFEPVFLPCSFGFRPNRSVQDAVYCASRLRRSGYAWVVDGDIAAYFDNMDHRLLLKLVEKRIQDHRVLNLIENWLAIGAVESGFPVDRTGWLEMYWQKTAQGLRQGTNWVLGLLSNQVSQEDSYLKVKLERSWNDPTMGGLDEDSHFEDYCPSGALSDEADPTQTRDTWRRQALRQLATSSLLVGSGLIRQALTKAGPVAVETIKSQIGREALRRGLVAGGGAVGAVAGLALTAFLVYRQSAPTSLGILQGSPLSPLLANIYLHPFDLTLTKGGFRLVRFADDWAILCPNREVAEKAFNQAVISLNRLKLKINQEKTQILSPADRFDWLGETVGAEGR